MNDPDESDRRIKLKELELAKLQSEETAFKQLEAYHAQNVLKRTLTVAERIAQAAHNLINDFDDNVHQMSDDLTGKK